MYQLPVAIDEKDPYKQRLYRFKKLLAGEAHDSVHANGCLGNEPRAQTAAASPAAGGRSFRLPD
jgi:hypothetical protein